MFKGLLLDRRVIDNRRFALSKMAVLFLAFVCVLFAVLNADAEPTAHITSTSTIDSANQTEFITVDAQTLSSHPEFLNQLDMLNEYSKRRRVNTLFENPQGNSQGLQFNHVNSFTGNLTFARRDMVVVARMPITITRYYDSSVEFTEIQSETQEYTADFASGWFLNYNQSLTLTEDNVYLYTDETGRKHALKLNGVRTNTGSLLASPWTLTRPAQSESVDTLMLTHSNGVSKSFALIGQRYRLIRQQDAFGNGLTFHYHIDSNQLSEIKADNGRTVTIKRDEKGRITSIKDNQQRFVSYQYNAQGQLSAV